MGSQGAGEGERHPGDISVWRHLVDACEWGEGTRYTLVKCLLMMCPLEQGNPLISLVSVMCSAGPWHTWGSGEGAGDEYVTLTRNLWAWGGDLMLCCLSVSYSLVGISPLVSALNCLPWFSLCWFDNMVNPALGFEIPNWTGHDHTKRNADLV